MRTRPLPSLCAYSFLDVAREKEKFSTDVWFSEPEDYIGPANAIPDKAKLDQVRDAWEDFYTETALFRQLAFVTFLHLQAKMMLWQHQCSCS